MMFSKAIHLIKGAVADVCNKRHVCLGTCLYSTVPNGCAVTFTNTKFKLRTHRCGEVRTEHVGGLVTLHGWLEYKRGDKFFTLRDATGSCQVLCDLGIKLPTKESVVALEGIVQLRPEKDINPNMATGNLEVHCTKFDLLNKCRDLAFTPNNYSGVKEETRMRHRYLDIRSKMMQQNLRLRSSFILNLRKYLCEEQGFVDVETPTLFCRTPGGAQEFLVPTQRPGMFYSLPQSPQQFKQLLMAGGIDRYMQVARCYRDEGSKPDRQPEFTQLDLELSFSTQEQIMTIVEDMLVKCWPNHLPTLTGPFPRMAYKTAMEQYGVDKPDTRFGCTINDLTKETFNLPLFKVNNTQIEVKGINISGGCRRLKPKQINDIQRSVEKRYSVKVAVVRVEENGNWNSPLVQHMEDDILMHEVNKKLSVEENDLLFICSSPSWKTACETLGQCRILSAKLCTDNGHPLYVDEQFKFLWVEDFPLFEYENDKIQSAHHPFTAPIDEDFPLLMSDPMKARGQHYDLVLNGCEIGGGSIRIHNSETQKYVLETVLKEDSRPLQHLLKAFDSGCPPHGGIALGLDRLLSIMCGSPSIRDVIAFPKSTEGSDLMSNAPSQVSAEDMTTYHLTVQKT